MFRYIFLLALMQGLTTFPIAFAVVPEDACSLPDYSCTPKQETYRGFSTKLEACMDLLEIKNSVVRASYYTPPIDIRFSAGLPSYVFQCVGDRYWTHDDHFYERGAFDQVAITYTCPTINGVTWLGSGVLEDGRPACVSSARKCYPSFLMGSSGQCELWCAKNELFDSATNQCKEQPKTENCQTQTDHPIDLFEGKKYRNEPILSAGVRYPFSISYLYSNHRNREKSPTGNSVSTSLNDAGRYKAATTQALTMSEYRVLVTDSGIARNGSIDISQYLGNMDQYWRHNYDDVLIAANQKFIYNRPRGDVIQFDGYGSSAAYPYLRVQELSGNEESFSGHKIINSKTGEIRKFDQFGRLIKVQRDLQDTLTLTYDTSNKLNKIINAEGSYIQLDYQALTKNSVYSTIASNQNYPVRFSNDRGESAELQWNQDYQGQLAQFHLITQITNAIHGTSKTARLYEYTDARFPASLTDIYFTDNTIGANKKSLYHFEYDAEGRAVYSGLPGSMDSITVDYLSENSRTVTNALGKQASYSFTIINGVKRLQSVLGEPTQNCLSSAAEYEYDMAGNVQSKAQNGQITEYQYDMLNREVSRTEAAGTAQARMVTTDYHPIFNKPIKITEPSLITEMEYDTQGRLTVIKRAARIN